MVKNGVKTEWGSGALKGVQNDSFKMHQVSLFVVYKTNKDFGYNGKRVMPPVTSNWCIVFCSY